MKCVGTIQGESPTAGSVYAGYDGDVRFTEPKLAKTRLGAILAPYKTEAAARAALIAAGAKIVDPRS